MKRLIAISTVMVLGYGAVAMASPGHGDVHRADLARGAHPADGTIEFKAGDETVVFTVTMPPGSTSGWHRHPGAVVVLVKAGTLTTYGLDQPPCVGVDIPTGQAYFEDNAATAQWPHFVRNKGTDTLELVVTAFGVAPGAAARSDAPAPSECSEPE
jgi:hypothetical protein